MIKLHNIKEEVLLKSVLDTVSDGITHAYPVSTGLSVSSGFGNACVCP